jgi:MFS family permease
MRSRQEPLLLSNTTNNTNTRPPQDEAPQSQQPSCCTIITEWLCEAVWPGLGLFGESYMLFSIGILTPIWQRLFPNCFLYHTVCSPRLLHSLSLSVVFGIISGMLFFGLLANCAFMGRRRGSIATALFMSCGALGLTVASFVLVDNGNTHDGDDDDDDDGSSNNSNSREQLLVIVMSMCLFMFGLGVGGEYPLAAASASEKAMEQLQQRKQLEERESVKQQQDQGQGQTCKSVVVMMMPDHSRGRKVQLVFAMQGMGIFCNSLLMTLLLLVFRDSSTNNDPDENVVNSITSSLIFIWRITYSLGTLVLLGVLLSRCWFLQESSVWQEQQQQQAEALQAQLQLQQQQAEALQHEQCQIQEQQQQASNTGGMMVVPPWSALSVDAAAAAAANAEHPSATAIMETSATTQTTTTTTLPKQPPQKQQHHLLVHHSPSNISTVSSLSMPSVVDDDSATYMIMSGHGFTNSRHNSTINSCSSSGRTPACISPPTTTSTLPIVPEIQDDDNDYYNDDPTTVSRAASSCTANTITKQQQQQQHRFLFLQNYGMRLFGVSSCWLLWDIAFYGNKLFQSTFILALTATGASGSNSSGSDDNESISLLQFSTAATLNAGVALCGYFVAAFLVDQQPGLGRRGLQLSGFALTGLLFVACAFFYSTAAAPTTLIIVLYLATSFFGQVGPNATTFLLPAEIFPTAVRTQCHGMAAACGKVGALIAAAWFPHLATLSSSRSNSDDSVDENESSSAAASALDLFLVSGYASLAACAITYWTIPETAGLDLYEMDKKWTCIVQGKKGDYQGPANQAQFLSPYERFQLLLRTQQAAHYNHAADAY